jgi:hypothetical protein
VAAGREVSEDHQYANQGWAYPMVKLPVRFNGQASYPIHYERFYNGFYAPYFHIQLLGCNTKITDKLKLNVFMHI